MRRVASVIFALSLSTWIAACGHPDAGAGVMGNVRLGMAPRDVRDRFQPGSDGRWQTALGAGDDTVLVWTAGQAGPVTDARFEFHLGMLVAIRAHLTETVAKDDVSSTPKTVTLRGPSTDGQAGTTFTVLARDCPTHKDEADALAARAAR